MRIKLLKKTIPMIILLSMLFSWTHTRTINAEANREIATQPQVVGNYIEVDAIIFLSNSYQFYDPNLRHKVEATIRFNFTTPPAQNYQIAIQTFISSVKVAEVPSNATYTYGFWGYPPIGLITFNMPGNLSLGIVKLEGYVTGSSVLFRDAVEIPVLFRISSPIGYVSSFILGFSPPQSSKIQKIYSPDQPTLSIERTLIDGHECIIISKIYPGIRFLVLYEHDLWTPAMVSVLVAAISLLIGFPYITRFFSRASLPYKSNNFFNKVRNFGRKLQKQLFKLNVSNLLAVYMMFALFMVSLSLMVGPDPRLKVYVLSSTLEVSSNINGIVENRFGGVSITVFDEMSEFPTLTNLGIFSAVIIADFYPPNERILREYIYPGFDNLPSHYNSIIIVKQYAEEKFASNIQERYGEKVVVVDDVSSMAEFLAKIPRRNNLFGFKVDSASYLKITAFLGVCSLIIVFIGMAFLSFALIDAGKKPLQMGLFEAIVFSAFTFLFTEIVYIVCGVLLAMPLGLHSGGARVTAVGLFGFGGGSRPRMLAGFLGFIFGALISLKEGLKIGRMGMATFLIAIFFIVVDPLTSGLIFYEFILIYTGTPYTFETAEVTMFHVKDFLSSFGTALGGWTSPTLLISTGVILYYVGAIPFFLFSRMQRNTAAFMLFFCAFSAASGGIRVSNMRPWDAFMSLLPGVVAGMVAVLIFYGMNFLELFFKRRLEKDELI